MKWVVLPILSIVSISAISLLSDGLIRGSCNCDVPADQTWFVLCFVNHKSCNPELVCDNHVTCESVTCSNGTFYPCGK